MANRTGHKLLQRGLGQPGVKVSKAVERARRQVAERVGLEKKKPVAAIPRPQYAFNRD